MLIKTEAIVLSSVKYGDSSIILKTYTRQEGIKSFIAGGVHTKKGPLRPAMVQAMSQLQLIYYNKGKGNLKRIKEATVYKSYSELYFDPVKSSISMFLAEVLSHLLNEEEQNYALFDFLSTSLMQLDTTKTGIGNFHLVFLFRLMDYMGFSPQSSLGGELYFDLWEGRYVPSYPEHFHFLNKEETIQWREFQQAMDAGAQLKLSKEKRAGLLQAILDYYRLHVKDFGNLRSLDILKTLLS